MPNYESGITSGSQRFTFKAEKQGKYVLICGLPGHGQAGQWIWFYVDAPDSQPSFQAGNGQPYVPQPPETEADRMRKADLGRKLLLAATAAGVLGLALFAAGSGGAGFAGSAAAQAAGGVDISAPPVTVAQWSTSGGDRAEPVTGTVTLDGLPVSGAVVVGRGVPAGSADGPAGAFCLPGRPQRRRSGIL